MATIKKINSFDNSPFIMTVSGTTVPAVPTEAKLRNGFYNLTTGLYEVVFNESDYYRISPSSLLWSINGIFFPGSLYALDSGEKAHLMYVGPAQTKIEVGSEIESYKDVQIEYYNSTFQPSFQEFANSVFIEGNVTVNASSIYTNSPNANSPVADIEDEQEELSGAAADILGNVAAPLKVFDEEEEEVPVKRGRGRPKKVENDD